MKPALSGAMGGPQLQAAFLTRGGRGGLARIESFHVRLVFEATPEILDFLNPLLKEEGRERLRAVCGGFRQLMVDVLDYRGTYSPLEDRSKTGEGDPGDCSRCEGSGREGWMGSSGRRREPSRILGSPLESRTMVRSYFLGSSKS
mmetsp:Transcript_50310/g.99073  ORF Transcript_50310/g.99073 Transcript_50310/m.99073 type:complete len:145 (-) Transcript_50310:1756-2190(-)